jgi:hypothetical protein
MMKSALAFVGCASMIGASAHYHGRFNDQSAARTALMNRAAERVAVLPLTIGDWEGTERTGVDEEAMRRGGAVRYASRVYRHRTTGDVFNVLLLAGKPGPLSVHTPEICNAGPNHAPQPNQQRWSPRPGDEFTWQSFASKIDGRPDLEIGWAWSTNGRWQSPAVPRIAFGREPFLYKLYVVRACNKQTEPSQAMKRLLSDWLPALERTVFAAPVVDDDQEGVTPPAVDVRPGPTPAPNPPPARSATGGPRV